MKRYILYGTGLEAEEFIWREQQLFSNIDFCIDRDAESRGRDFHGIPIFKLEEIEKEEFKDRFVIVAGKEDAYLNIKTLLQEMGLIEFEDFSWSYLYHKKLVVFNTNCYGRHIRHILNLQAAFTENYYIYPLTMIHENKQKKLPNELIKTADVFIHQDIQANNKFSYKLSDEYITSLLRTDCINITVPNCVGMGGWCFPNLTKECKRYRFGAGEVVLYQDKVIDEAVDKGFRGGADIKEYWVNYSYSAELLSDLWTAFMGKIRAREKNWDIKLTPFIEDKYRSRQLFIDTEHLSYSVYQYIAKGICGILGIADYKEVKGWNDEVMQPILPTVKKYYAMDFSQYGHQAYLWTKRVEDMITTYIQAYMWLWNNKAIIN